MLSTQRSFRGMVVAPHHLAADAGCRVLQDGGNAIEAMIAAASTIAVVYPHMNGLGGDNFWLVHTPRQMPMGIDACGAAAEKATPEFYSKQGFEHIPNRGPLAALTVAGALSGWHAAYNHSLQNWDGTLSLERLLEEATHYARSGVAVTKTLAKNAADKLAQLRDQPGFSGVYLNDGVAPEVGDRFIQPAMAETLYVLAREGLDSFYRGELAKSIAGDLQAVGSPIAANDLSRQRALQVAPLTLEVSGHQLFNMPPPTQGLTSLMLLGVFDRLQVEEAETFEFVHGLVEATKQSFRVRDLYVTDPDYMEKSATTFLKPDLLDKLASGIDPRVAQPWPDASVGGDTVWLGAIDQAGRAVSFIQSMYWEFGSGVALPQTGITWQNRGTSFSLDPSHHNCLQPFRRPLHTIQPALAHLRNGQVMPYGTMGGEGQPQTQAMLFSRHVLFGQDLQEAISAPRWLLGRTWGSEVTSLRLENRFTSELIEQLTSAGHDVELIGAYDEIMGHAGALVRHPNGLIEGAADPRSDGSASAC